MIVIFLLALIFMENIHAAVTISLEASNDYIAVIGKNKKRGYYGEIVSGATPAFSPQVHFSMGQRYGVRLKYKKQIAVFDEPEDYNLKGKTHTLQGTSLELTYLHNLNFQSCLRYKLQDRLLFSINQSAILKLYKMSSHEAGYCFLLETKNKRGFKIGLGGWGSLISMENMKSADLFPDLGTELGVNLKMGYLTHKTAWLLRWQFSTARINAKPYTYQILETGLGIGFVYFF